MSAGNGAAASPPEAVALPTEVARELTDEERALYADSWGQISEGATNELLLDILRELRSNREATEQLVQRFDALCAGMGEAMKALSGGGLLGMLGAFGGR